VDSSWIAIGEDSPARGGYPPHHWLISIAESALFPKPVLFVFLFLSTQIVVCLVDPIGAWGIEHVEVDRVYKGFGFVGHVARDGEDFARVDHDFFAVDPELEGAFEDIGDLLIVVAVQGDNAALLHEDAGDHDVLADYQLALQERVEVL
jgi:hypothetical protein